MEDPLRSRPLSLISQLGQRIDYSYFFWALIIGTYNDQNYYDVSQEYYKKMFRDI